MESWPTSAGSGNPIGAFQDSTGAWNAFPPAGVWQLCQPVREASSSSRRILTLKGLVASRFRSDRLSLKALSERTLPGFSSFTGL
jgi:hypothetical protein